MIEIMTKNIIMFTLCQYEISYMKAVVFGTVSTVAFTNFYIEVPNSPVATNNISLSKLSQVVKFIFLWSKI